MRKITAKDIEGHWHDTFDDVEDYFYRSLYPDMVYGDDEYGNYYVSFSRVKTEEDLDDIIPCIESKTSYRDLFKYLESLDFRIIKRYGKYCVSWPSYDSGTKEWKWRV